MTTKSLSERLRKYAGMPKSMIMTDVAMREAADALDRQAAEIELLKEGRQLHDEHADHLEHELAAQSVLLAGAASEMGRLIVLLAKAEEALENAACSGVKGASETLAAIRKEQS